ncbi:hypothetical protein SLE2022_352970 [Rubroshorea leprosula]
MAKSMTILLLVLVLHYGVSMAMGYIEGGESSRGGREEREEEESLFLSKGYKQVVKTDAGEVRVARRVAGPMHLGFIIMEPQSLFIPQYLDSSLMLFVHRGEVRIGLVYEDEAIERWLKMGDLYWIPAGSAFYMVNPAEGQCLHIICSIDKSESLGMDPFQSFFIGGGSSILVGFPSGTLSTAFNASKRVLGDVLRRHLEGPIVYTNRSHAPNFWTKFIQLRETDRLQHLKKMVEFRPESGQGDEGQMGWSWRKLLNSFFGIKDDLDCKNGASKSPDSYNLYHKKPDFRNNYGWSVALDGSDYSALKYAGIGVYLVYLTAGSMMAPHVNPTATEYGFVLRGTGRIQIVFPNGTSALDTKVREGDVFWVPRYFAFCQIASRAGPFVFFGFTTSAEKNRPQFLVGENSLLNKLRGPELAAALGTTEERVEPVLRGQREAVILPSSEATLPREEKAILGTIEDEMIMGF